MVRHVMLNNVDHHDLKVVMRHGAEFGDNVSSVLAVPTEFEDLQREYPIFFRKDSKTGDFAALALLGFAKNENLFLDGERWNAHYVPGFVARGPFFVGFQQSSAQTSENMRAVVHVDLDDARVSRTEGKPLFSPQGGNSGYLLQITAVLDGLSRGMAVAPAMFAAFAAAELIEPVDVEVRIAEQEQYNLRGLHTINQKKLAALSGESLEALHRAGYLRGAFLVAASLGNVQKLIELKRRRLSGKAPAES